MFLSWKVVHRYICLSESDKISSLLVFYVDEKFTHQVIYFNTKSSIFYVKVKIYTSSLSHCYQLPIFLNESTYLLIKILALVSSFLYLYGIQFFLCLHNFVQGIKNICQVYTFINQEGLVMTRLKEPGRSGNYVLWNSTWPRLWFLHNVEECFETILSWFNQSNGCLELRDGDQAEFLSRRLEQYEQTLCVLYQRLTETCPRQDAIRHDVEQIMNALRQLFPLVSEPKGVDTY